MKVIGKHRELLIEMLIYYLNNDNYNHIQFSDFIHEEDPMGRHWTKYYIDEYKERVLPYNLHPNKKLGIKR
jgi:hypothetical protein